MQKLGPTSVRIAVIICLLLVAVVAILLWQDRQARFPSLKDHMNDTHVTSGFEIRVLTANVGNLSLGCRKYYNNLCYQDVEERIAHSIALLRPDVIVLQEVTDPEQCMGFIERDPKKVCYEYQKRVPFYQARRLIGSDYTIVCDSRRHYECIAVHVDIGTIEGYAPGEFCREGATTDIPTPGCDIGFTVSKVTAILYGMRVGIVNAHPQSTDVKCREWAIRQIFEEVDGRPPLASEQYNLLLGDFNIDPFREDDVSIQLWNQYVGLFDEGRPYWYHSGPAEKMPPYPTSSLFVSKKTVDYIISNFAEGICVTLGETPGTIPIDGGRGMDHRAIFGRLYIPQNLAEQ